MNIKILGPGCANCTKLEQNTLEALKGSNAEYNIDKVTDPVDIMKFGVMSTPGLVVDDKVVAYGRVLSPEEIKSKLTL